jgi:DNA-binding CsgD family transcriptional regulator
MVEHELGRAAARRVHSSSHSERNTEKSLTNWFKGALDQSPIPAQTEAANAPAGDELSKGQLDCLLLVGQYLTSKEIGSILGISHHTVDQRIRLAMRSLGVTKRRHAARIVAERYAPIFQWTVKSAEPFVLPTRAESRSSLRATPARWPKEINVALRAIWIVTIVFGATLSLAIYLAGLHSLGRLLHH